MTATAVLPRPRRSPEDGGAAPPRAGGGPASRAEASERVLHQLVRRELRVLAGTSAWSDPEDGARTTALTRHAELVSRVLLHHHAVERERVWPALRRAVPAGTADAARLDQALEAWTASCARIDLALRDVGTAARQWAVARTPAARTAFSAACRALSRAVDAQTAEEERTLLPLLTAHLDREGWAGATRGACAGLSLRERLVVLGAALEDAGAGDRARLLAGLPLGTRMAWHLLGRGRYRAAVVRLRGEPPAL